ncbi:hypothetical protein [Mycobacterium sp.]|uniref:DUF7159 family protein n=1 Tax=Mycobacterium sp. TaxID=1785 RepID=UPI0025CCDC5D|nr:hypothetical protein [Mycobacterium sp.]MBW0014088.1 hypothetical protein [Mycobacterium sp.]
MAPTAVRLVLVEGENGDGATVEEDNFEVPAEDDAATIAAADQVVSAILGTREGAAEGGYQLASTGVTFTDSVEAAALRDALAAHKVENVMLVSAFLAAAALAQTVGNQTNYARTALLYVEPDTATLAVVDSADGSIVDVQRQALPEDDETAVTELAALVSGAEALEPHPDAVFVVGSGVDIPMIMPALEAATTLPLTAPEEPETALARGAALASANAPLFASTAALAYAQDPGTGAIDSFALTPGNFQAPADAGATALAYSAFPDGFGDPYDVDDAASAQLVGAGERDRRPLWLVGSAVAAIFVVGMAALAASLAIAIRPTAGVRPAPDHPVVAPTQAALAPAAPAQAPAPEAPAPLAPAAPAPASAPEASAPAPEASAPAPGAPVPAPVAQVPAPAAPAPVPAAPAQAPVPGAPAPVLPPPMAPVPVPIPLPIPVIGAAPGSGFGPGFGPGGGAGGGHGGEGPFGGGPFGGGHGPFGGGHGGFGRH